MQERRLDTWLRVCGACGLRGHRLGAKGRSGGSRSSSGEETLLKANAKGEPCLARAPSTPLLYSFLLHFSHLYYVPGAGLGIETPRMMETKSLAPGA